MTERMFKLDTDTNIENWAILSPRNESEPYPVVTPEEALNIVQAIREALGE